MIPDPDLPEVLEPLAAVAARAVTVRDGPRTDGLARSGAVKLLRSLQLARLALEYQAKMPGGIALLESERAERFGTSHER